VRQKLDRLERQHALDKERSRIAKDMHDDLGANLTRISLLGDLAEEQLGEPEEARKSVRRMADTSREVVRSMDEILWALNPKNDTLENLASFLGDFAREHLELAGVLCRLEFSSQLPDCALTSEIRHNLLLAVKETFNNVVKHAEASEVHFRLGITGSNILELSVADNGKGFSPAEQNSEGDGLSNMPRRLESIGGQFILSSHPGKGTTVCIRFPLPPK
jgi:signal transduction histidine kinase